MPTLKKFYLKNYGCQMNVYDAQAMENLLTARGWQKQDDPDTANLIILNSCHIREKATEKIYSDIGRLKKYRTATHHPLIAVAGCVAQAEGEAMIHRQPAIDFVFGPQNFQQLPAMIAKAQQGKKSCETEFLTPQKFAQLNKLTHRQQSVSAFLTVQEGCDKFCSFCVVPYTRGQEVSRDPKHILMEAKKLIAKGIKEITLLGQNVNAYHASNWRLADLLNALANLPDIKRLRYTTSHPLDMDKSLIHAHRDNPKLAPFIHLPVQSGSDKILKKMNRKHTQQHYRDIIHALRQARPDITLSSDFIVGFPEEDETDFQATLDLARDIGFAQAYSFKYSPRPGTKSAEAEQIPEPVKSERLARLNHLLRQQQMDFHQQAADTIVEVLAERPRFGKNWHGQHVHFEPAVKPGSIVRVHIQHAAPHHLAGKVKGNVTGNVTGNAKEEKI